MNKYNIVVFSTEKSFIRISLDKIWLGIKEKFAFVFEFSTRLFKVKEV